MRDAPFPDRLDAAIQRLGSPACVGLDPVLDRLPEPLRAANSEPAAAMRAFCEGVLNACSGTVPAVKFQSACFERYGAAGVAALHDSMARARDLGFIVVLDAKRGDIGVTNEHYAAATAAAGAHVVTVSPYLGLGVIEPFLRAGIGVLVLVRTSNPDSDEFQSRRLGDGRTVAEMIADAVAHLGDDWLGAGGRSAVGAVVGATKSGDGPELRRRMPRQYFLVPGIGAQGGTAADVRPLLDASGGGVLVTASRSVIYPPESGAGWERDIAAAAAAFARDLAS